MNTATQIKNERINLRMKSSSKNLIVRAAGFEGKTVSHFILASALKRAEETVREYEMMSLNAENSMTFLEAITAPVNFNNKLTAALEEYDKQVISK